MKYDIIKEFNKNTLISHFLLALENDAVKKMSKEFDKRKDKKDRSVEVKMTVDGHEVNVKKVIDNFDGQFDRMVKEKALKIFNKKFESIFTDKILNIEEVIEDLKSRLDEEVEKRMADWEKEYEQVNDFCICCEGKIKNFLIGMTLFYNKKNILTRVKNGIVKDKRSAKTVYVCAKCASILELDDTRCLKQ